MSIAITDHTDSDSIDIFGFWLYIMTDCVLFATLFATFAVLRNNIYTGPALTHLFSLPFIFGETLFLLFSSFTFGLVMLGLYEKNKKRILFWLSLTFLLGLSFVVMEVREFIHIVAQGYTWHTSGALSAFFALVGVHGLHVAIGLFWILLMIIQVARSGPSKTISRRLTYLGLFWHFLDIVWIFVFTIVYLMGAI